MFPQRLKIDLIEKCIIFIIHMEHEMVNRKDTISFFQKVQSTNKIIIIRIIERFFFNYYRESKKLFTFICDYQI